MTHSPLGPSSKRQPHFLNPSSALPFECDPSPLSLSQSKAKPSFFHSLPAFHHLLHHLVPHLVPPPSPLAPPRGSLQRVMIVPAEDVDTALMVDAILTVKDCVAKSRSETFRGLQSEVDQALGQPKFDPVRSGCDLFRLRITKHLKGVSEKESMVTVRRVLEGRCQYYYTVCNGGPLSIVNDVLPFVRETSTVLVHGQGTLLATMIACAMDKRPGVRFIILQGTPTNNGATLMERVLRDPTGYNNRDLIKRSCTVVDDAACATALQQADFVLAGANCVTEHGGLVHSTGSLQVAMLANAMNIPFYVLCETFKFTRIFPLSTSDIRQPQQQQQASTAAARPGAELVPLLEFVPPSLVSLVFTEEGIMPPSAVADEMFRIHTGREGLGTF